MRAEGDSETGGAVAMDAGRSQFTELLLCHKKKLRRDLNVKGHQKEGETNKGEKSPGICLREEVTEGRGGRGCDLAVCVCVCVCMHAQCVPLRWQSSHLVHCAGCNRRRWR